MKSTSAVKRTTVKSRTPKNRLESPLEQKVQEVAYQLYLARGCANGYDVEDWLQAEQIVKGV